MPTYDFGRPESGGEPGVVAELAPAHAAPGEVLGEAAHRGDEGGLAAPGARDRCARLLAAARGAVARDAVPERARQQSSGPVDGLHRGIGLHAALSPLTTTTTTMTTTTWTSVLRSTPAGSAASRTRARFLSPSYYPRLSPRLTDVSAPSSFSPPCSSSPSRDPFPRAPVSRKTPAADGDPYPCDAKLAAIPYTRGLSFVHHHRQALEVRGRHAREKVRRSTWCTVTWRAGVGLPIRLRPLGSVLSRPHTPA